MRVKLIDQSVAPDGTRIVPALGHARVTFGQTVEVPDDVAGTAPTGEPGDLGSGLLAQTDVWALADENTED